MSALTKQPTTQSETSSRLKNIVAALESFVVKLENENKSARAGTKAVVTVGSGVSTSGDRNETIKK